MRLDAMIFGGGAAGLWLLDQLSRAGHHVLLLESSSLGAGQTIASQGIIHGGLKYTLQGFVTKSAAAIREMPDLWRNALLGARSPNLSATRLRAECCHLWQTTSLSSRAGMIGAKIGLRVKPETLAKDDRPEALGSVPGTVARLAEQVIAVDTFLADLLTQYSDRILQCDTASGVKFHLKSPGEVSHVTITNPLTGKATDTHPNQLIFTAGGGNGELRRQAGLSSTVMQKRPLHMVMARGKLPLLNGHCVDGSRTRVTVTSETTPDGQTVWQVGGQLAEDGVGKKPQELVEFARSEVASVLPGVSLQGIEWGTYCVDRAEGVTLTGGRPDNIQVLCAGNVTTGWPTKLALAPVLAQEIASRVAQPDRSHDFATEHFADWPRPSVAALPWVTCENWTQIGQPGRVSQRAA